VPDASQDLDCLKRPIDETGNIFSKDYGITIK